MKYRVIIEYEVPDDAVHDKHFSSTVLEMTARRAVSEYLYSREQLRRNALEALYKITSTTNERYTG